MSGKSLRERSQPIDEIIGNNFRILRANARMTQAQLAEQLGITFQQVQKYERGTNRIAASTLYKASKILNVGLLSFFKGLDSEAEIMTFSRQEMEWLRLYNELPADDVRKHITRMIKTAIENERRA